MPANGETVLQELRCSLRELGRISLFERPDRDASELAAEMAPGPRNHAARIRGFGPPDLVSCHGPHVLRVPAEPRPSFET
jgi:hypothetical protein